MTRTMAAMVVAGVAGLGAACGGTTPTSPSAAMTTSMTGAWAGLASDSSTTMGTGAMMGQVGLGTMTWQLTETGTTVTGVMSFSGMRGGTPGVFTGTVSGDDITFTMVLPSGSMMSAGCTAQATGALHVNRSTMTMIGSYQGTNACTGPFTGGQMTMSRG